MLASVDLYGLAALIASVAAGLASILTVVVNGRKIDTGTAQAKASADLAAVVADTAAQKITEVHDEVKSPNGSTTGQTVSDLSHDVATLAAQVGAHLADGHGGPLA